MQMCVYIYIYSGDGNSRQVRRKKILILSADNIEWKNGTG